MARKQVYSGYMSKRRATELLKTMLEDMKVYDYIRPTPLRIKAVEIAIEVLEQNRKEGQHGKINRETIQEEKE